MSKPKPFNMRVIDAVGDSNLPQDLRHLLLWMAYLANGKTGQGLSGQETIGAKMGCSGREVRRKLERLNELADSPVKVLRSYRSRKDGRGRTSDVYQLALTNRTPVSGEAKQPTGRRRPVEEGRNPSDQPDVKRGPTGRETLDQADAGVRGSTEGSTETVHGDSLSPAKLATRTTPSKPKKSTKSRNGGYTPEQKQAHTRLTKHYHAEFERLRLTKPIGWGAKEGRAVYELLAKLDYDVARAESIVTSGLHGWNKATIMSIAANPSACVVAAANAIVARGPDVRASDRLERHRQRILELQAKERRPGGAA